MAVLLILTLLLCGCAKTAGSAGEIPEAAQTPAEAAETAAPEATEAPAGPAIETTDMTGRALTLENEAARIVVLDAADAEILCAIGAEDTLVGRGEYCDYPESIAALPAVSSGSETNIEQILALSPDLVVMTKMSQTEEQVKQLEGAGVPVLITDAQDIEGVYTAIGLLGTVTGKAAEGEALAASMREGFDALKREASGKTVYFEVSPLEWGLWTAGAGTFMNEIAALLGLENAFADVDGWAGISEEQVFSRNPDYIVTVTMYYGEGPTPEEEILARAGWENLSAVQNGAVFAADSNMMTRPGPRLLDAAKALSEFVYGFAALSAAA